MKRLVFTLVCLSFVFSSAVNANGLDFIETSDGKRSSDIRELVQWTHSRLVFKKSIDRVAVGQNAVLNIEVIDNNEVLALAKAIGRTSILVWYGDGSSETFLFSVTKDLSVLKQALSDIHPNVLLTLAPDREALVLRGRVPTIKHKLAAESAAKHYLNADSGSQDNGVLVQPTTANLLSDLAANLRLQQRPAQLAGQIRGRKNSATIINLIQVEKLPLDMPEKIKAAISKLGGGSVGITRVQKSDLPDDANDVFLLDGYVETQVDLVRVMSIASRLVRSANPNPTTGSNASGISAVNASGNNDRISTLANESGGLVTNGGSGGSRSGILAGLSSGGASSNNNNLSSNIARAKLLSSASGRLLSTITVRDLPQVRVAIQMYEVNRRKLKQWQPKLSIISNGYDNSGGLFGLAGNSSRQAGAAGIENALQVLGGALVNNVQLATRDIAFDLLFSALEDDGVARTLSRPNITVLAGETAVFRAGGEIPVPTSFAAQGISANDDNALGGVFSGTQFKAFGVELTVKAMVDENDVITLDLTPSISSPDTLLTQQLSGSTGAALNSAAFNVRSLSTSTRLKDGQPLVIGGLVSQDISENSSGTPGLRDLPLLEHITESSSINKQDKELIIIVTPTLVRHLAHRSDTWVFPVSQNLVSMALKNQTKSQSYKMQEND